MCGIYICKWVSFKAKDPFNSRRIRNLTMRWKATPTPKIEVSWVLRIAIFGTSKATMFLFFYTGTALLSFRLYCSLITTCSMETHSGRVPWMSIASGIAAHCSLHYSNCKYLKQSESQLVRKMSSIFITWAIMVFQKCLKYTLCLSPSCFSWGWPLQSRNK